MAAGAAIGGLTALVAGGLQSYMGLKASRSQARKQQKLNAAIEAKNNALAARERADALEGQKYNRRTAAIQSQWQAIQAAQKHVEDILARNAELKQRFIQSGR
jgi:DNA anti-recombination protein RmuC